MLIAQITDVHLGFQPNDPNELNRKRLDDVIHALLALTPQPDLLLATGDLTENGTIASYQTLKTICTSLPFPVLPALGNHDDRSNFAKVFPEFPLVNGYLQYVHDLGPVRIIMLDTLEVGRHGGSFCEVRATWLEAQLAETHKPVIVVLHHPPIETGNGWMTEAIDADWVLRLREVITRHRHVIRLVTGHLHRAIVTGWGGSTLAVCPSSAPQVALDFRPIDPDTPDGRSMIVAESPGFALHYWNGHDLITHFGSAGDHAILARYNERMQPVVRHILAEHVAHKI